MDYQVIKPAPILTDFVESFWSLSSNTEQDKEIVILPDGRIDLIFAWSDTEPLHVMLMNLDREASQHTLHAGTVMFAVSLKLPALEYLLEVTGISDQPMLLPTSFWGVNTDDFKSLEGFVNRISSAILATLSNKKIDPRKKKLFQLIYQTKGAMTVAAMSDEACWTARQINRYFNDRVGLSLKEYCSILKFHASFPQIKEGRLFPEGAFADQAHFIKTIKKFSGVTPKALSKNKNDRFIQFSATPEE